MKKLIVVAVLMMLVVPGMLVSAQQPPAAQGSLEYGVPFEAELTETEREIAYTFEGAAGDVVVIEMYPVEQYTEGNINASFVTLYDPGMTMVGFNDSGFFENVRYVAQLVTAGKHTIVAALPPDNTEASVGKFFIEVNKAVDLTAGEVSDEMTNEERRFYTVTSEKDFTLNYAQTDGSFAPLVTVNALGGDENLTALAFARGYFSNIALTVAVERSPSNIYVVVLEEDLGDFNFDTVEVEYTISVQ